MNAHKPYWTDWSPEDKQRCIVYHCKHLRDDHSQFGDAPCLQDRCLCEEFTPPEQP